IELSWMRGFPILADGANPARYHGKESPHVIVHYDRMVRDDATWAELAPEAVILRGEPPTSKLLRQRLAELDVRGYQIGEGKPGINPIHGRIEWAGASVASFVERCRGRKGHYGEMWSHRDRSIESSLKAALQEPHPLFEGDVHRLLGDVLPSGSAVFYASSMAIRDAEWFMPRRCEALIPFSQRGANGIDGTVSLARGIAGGLGRPVWVVAGDIAFLHDANGLLGAASDDPGIFVVLLNNSGGGIFEFLPVASRSPEFERFFATPQSVDFKQFVQAYGGLHISCPDLQALKSAIGQWDGKGLTVAEVPIDRKASVELHRKFLKGIFE
ncbi:MAG TPA: thiamine pyrophosphate-dependent enzyme, partial [Oceanipulchritudo sp.]|nr:thiamine pyrophosphate-dependent enzyme [Oceanipulchritudo sp.]